jgi:hypothetical protein
MCSPLGVGTEPHTVRQHGNVLPYPLSTVDREGRTMLVKVREHVPDSRIDRLTERDLNDVMEFDHVIRVRGDGTISVPEPHVYAPELHALSDAEGSHLPETDADLHRQAREQGWTLEAGWSGQHGYRGPCMHPSEYVGGALAEYIIAHPGLWVAVIVNEEDPDASDTWAILHRLT